MKVTFINEVADICDRVGADVHDVTRGIGLDGRIGRKFLHPGPGFVGSCFPKDTLALVRIAQEYGAPSRLVESVVAVNDARKAAMASRVIAACGGTVRRKTIAVLQAGDGRHARCAIGNSSDPASDWARSEALRCSEHGDRA